MSLDAASGALSSSRSLRNDVAIVVGGGSGIGADICAALAEAESRVAVVDVDGQLASDVARSLGSSACAIQADVGVTEESEAAVARTVETFGKATILVHCAVPSDPQGGIFEMSIEKWRRIIDVMLVGGYTLARAFAREVIKQRSGGRIVNITSAVVERPRLGTSAYCSAKSGMTGMTKVLAMELAPHGITVNAIGPGLTMTPKVARNLSRTYYTNFLQQVPLGRAAEGRDIAEAVSFIVSPAASYITGQALYVDGGYTAGSLLSRE